MTAMRPCSTPSPASCVRPWRSAPLLAAREGHAIGRRGAPQPVCAVNPSQRRSQLLRQGRRRRADRLPVQEEVEVVDVEAGEEEEEDEAATSVVLVEEEEDGDIKLVEPEDEEEQEEGGGARGALRGQPAAPAAAAAAGARPAAAPLGDAGAIGGPPRQLVLPHQEPSAAGPAQREARGGREVVEPDQVREPGQEREPLPLEVLEQLLAGEEEPAGNAREAALLDILNAGEQLEERIRQHQAIIDEDMLQLLLRRLEVAEALQQEEAVEGLRLLYRRLKAEVDRRAATPAMRLLDDLINILDPALDEGDGEAAVGSFEEGEGRGSPAAAGAVPGGRSGPGASGAARRARHEQAMARMQAAFGLGLPEDVNVLELASQLAQGGEQVAEGLFGESVEPEQFVTEVSALLGHAEAERERLARSLELMSGQLGAPGREAQRAEAAAVLEARDTAIELVREVLELVEEWRSAHQQRRLLGVM